MQWNRWRALRKYSKRCPGEILLCIAHRCGGTLLSCHRSNFQREGKQREAFKTMIREIAALAEAMGVPFERDMVEVNLKILSSLAPEATTSMQRDVMEGKDSEIDGLIYEVVRMGEKYHVPVPMYAKVAEKLRENL